MKINQKIWSLGILAVVIVAIAATGTYYVSRSRTWQLFGNLYWRVDTEEKVVALTFDDAPSKYVDEVLAELKKQDIKATFYVVGLGLEKDPEIGKSIVADGHELGNHSYSHKRFVFKSQEYIDAEISKTNELIKAAGYSGEITFRPPNGKKLFGLPWYLYRHQIKTVMWDVEPDTKYAGDVEKIIFSTLEETRPGSIVLLHPFCGQECAADREALPKIISGLKERGYRFVTINELIKYNNI